ncbi:MAG: hypothetical protein WD048_12395 [Chitinophagales bacterium]
MRKTNAGLFWSGGKDVFMYIGVKRNYFMLGGDISSYLKILLV